MKSLFQKKLVCSHCQGYFKKRVERGVVKYCCSQADAFGTCKRIPIREDFLILVVEHRFQQKLTHDEIRMVVEKIEIEDKMLFTIYLKDQEPIVYGEKFIRY